MNDGAAPRMVDEQNAVAEEPRVALNEPSWLRVISQISRLLNRAAAIVAAVLLVLMVLLILLEIGLRFFSLSTYMADALVGRGVAAITFLALGWTLEQGSMIRIQVITSLLSGFWRKAAAVFAILATEALVLWLSWFQFNTTAKLFAQGRTSETYFPIPLWIQQGIFLVGLWLVALTLLVNLLRLLATGADDHDTPLNI